jgi:ADP-ribosylglycohydrolase
MTVHDARDLRDLLADELAERRADGYDVTTFESDVAAALAEASGPRDPIHDTLLSQLEATARFEESSYDEPSSFDEIRALAPAIRSPAAWTRPDVQAGWDTDSNGATAGSAFGAMHGARALPAHMIDPLENRVDSAIAEFAGARISELADRTYRLVAKVDESTDKRC